MTKSEPSVKTIRTNFQTKYADNIKNGIYDIRDLESIENDDDLVTTYIRNDIPPEDLIHDSLKWRNGIKLNDLNEDSFDKWMWEKGAVYFHNKDKEGHRILHVVCRHHKKDAAILPSVKKFLGYAIEGAFKENRHSRIVVLFDMSEAGLSNLDMDLIKYIITCFKYYYPTFLSYMLIYEMPWIFNAAWKVIKAWLSQEAVKIIKFVTKSDIKEHINKDQILTHMGGTDKFVYKYPPVETVTAAGDSDTILLNSSRKKVTFADQDSQLYKSLSNDSFLQSQQDANTNAIIRKTTNSSRASSKCKKQNRDENSFIGRLLTISPAEELEFVIDGNGKESYEVISLTNTLPYSIAYKVKTTSPEKYRVRPSSGLVKSGSCTEVHVYLQAGFSSTINKDKFLIMAMEVTNETAESINELWNMVAKENIMEHRLRCTQSISDNTEIKPEVEPITLTSEQRLFKISTQLEKIQSHNVKLQNQVKWLFIIQLIMFFIFIAFLITLCFMFKDDILYFRHNACSSSSLF